MCGRYVVTNPVSKTKKIVKSAINIEDTENSDEDDLEIPAFLRRQKN